MFFRKKHNLKNNCKIIISRTDKIGDLVLSIPAFFMARKMYPKSKITVLVREYNAPVVNNLPFIDKVISIDSKTIGEIADKLKRSKPDVFIALYSDMYTLKLAKMSGAPIRIGPLSKFLSWFVYNCGIIQKRSRSVKNEAEYNLDLVRQLNTSLFDVNYSISGKIIYTSKNEKNADEFLHSNNILDKFIVIHPFAGGSAKNLTNDEYIKLIKYTIEVLPQAKIVITSSDSDYESALEIKKNVASDNSFVYKNMGDLLDLAAIIDRAEVYVGSSTGPSHIAGNLRKKCVCIYPAKKTQSVTRWGLFGNNNVDYIVPDKNNPNENYKNKKFDNINDDLLKSIADKVKDKYYEN